MYRKPTLSNIKGPEATALLLKAYSKETDNLQGKGNTLWPHRRSLMMLKTEDALDQHD